MAGTPSKVNGPANRPGPLTGISRQGPGWAKKKFGPLTFHHPLESLAPKQSEAHFASRHIFLHSAATSQIHRSSPPSANATAPKRDTPNAQSVPNAPSQCAQARTKIANGRSRPFRPREAGGFKPLPYPDNPDLERRLEGNKTDPGNFGRTKTTFRLQAESSLTIGQSH